MTVSPQRLLPTNVDLRFFILSKLGELLAVKLLLFFFVKLNIIEPNWAPKIALENCTFLKLF